MTANASRWTPWVVACAVLLLPACARKTPTAPPASAAEARILTEREVEELWSKATGSEPVGQPTVRRIPTEDGVRVVCGQAYAFRLTGGGGGTAVSSCGGSCLLTPGSTFGDCKTSGCVPSGRSCTPLVCSGGCTLREACKAELTTGFGSFFMQ